MKKQIIVIIAVVTAVIVGAVVLGICLSLKNNSGVPATPIWDSSEEYLDPLDDDTPLTEAQRAEIKKLYADHIIIFRYPFQERVIMGDIAADAPRMNLAAAKEIVANGGDIRDILHEFERIQPPDRIGGSGMTTVVFGLDGSDGIIFALEEESITHLRFASDGTVEYTEKLL